MTALLLHSGPCQLRASCWGPASAQRLSQCSNRQLGSNTLRWGRQQPQRVQAVSEEVLQLDEPEKASNGAQPGAGNGNGNGAAPANGKGNGVGLAPLSQSLVSIHAGERAGRPRIEDMLTTPIALTSTYFFKDTAELIAYQEGRYGSYEYGRYGNPTTRVVEEKIRELEGAEDCLVSSSGMNSATTMMLALVPAGGHIVTTTDCYRRTRQFIQTVLPKMGITATVVDPSDLKALERALDEHVVSLYFSESPTNPYLRCVDIQRISELCHARGAVVCIDGTFATPINMRAIDFGADLVLHSATKYLGGHNDLLAGALAGKSELCNAVRAMHNVLGGTIDPHCAYMLLRGMKTLGVRVKEQNATAFEIARRLEDHPRIARVHYPGLPSHPDHCIAKQQMHGFGGVISFEVDGDLEATSRFVDAVKIPYIAPSLGGCETLIEQPTVISYWDQGPAKRAELGIKDNLIRFSCGLEGIENIYSDIDMALSLI
eukprot:jgi/Astpho2/1122/fgenesh1_pm.00020_%23_9_t